MGSSLTSERKEKTLRSGCGTIWAGTLLWALCSAPVWSAQSEGGDATTATGEATIFPEPSAFASVEKWAEAIWIVQNRSGFTAELESAQPSYLVGEKAVFRFRTSRDCYLTLLNIGASGKLIMLLPNPYHPNPEETLVRAGRGWTTFPSAQDFEFTIQPPVGRERIKAVCTTRPLRVFENIDVSREFFQLQKQDRVRMRNVRPTRRPLDPQEWSVAQVQVTTRSAKAK